MADSLLVLKTAFFSSFSILACKKSKKWPSQYSMLAKMFTNNAVCFPQITTLSFQPKRNSQNDIAVFYKCQHKRSLDLEKQHKIFSRERKIQKKHESFTLFGGGIAKSYLILHPDKRVCVYRQTTFYLKQIYIN